MALYVVWTTYSGTKLTAPAPFSVDMVNPFTGETIPAANLTKVASMDHSVEQTLNIGSQSSGSGAGKVTFNDLKITKPIDRNSPTHFLNLCSGTAWEYLDVYKILAVQGTQTIVEGYRFGLAAGHDIDHAAAGATATLETLTYEYGGVLYGLAPQNPDGTYNTFTYAGWNRVKNIKWTGDPIT